MSLSAALFTAISAATASVATCGAAAQEPRTIAVETAEQLQQIFAEPVASIHVQLAPGRYVLEPSAYTDPTCGNCPPPNHLETSATTTIGLHIRGKEISISGPASDDLGDESIIETNAGYGLLIEDAQNVLLKNITITGGARSADGNATDGAVVVRRADLIVRNCTIRDNLGDEEIVRETISGVMGIVGREQSRITVDRCRIIRNSWDGIALYRGANAVIESTIVDGVDRSTGRAIGGGRGVGIGVTWDAQATVRNTLIRRYWKGLGVFVDGRVHAEHNVIEDIVTWGIALWGAGDGRPFAELRENVIYLTGACGVSIASQTEQQPGSLIGNIIVRSGEDERYDPPDRYCAQCPIALASVPDGFIIRDNLLHRNRYVGCHDAFEDLFEQQFREAIEPFCEVLRTCGVRSTSRFVAEICDERDDDDD